MSKRKQNKLEQVMGYKPLKDQKGRFIPYCDYGFHLGIPRKYKRCVGRQCRNLHKLYITEENKYGR